MRYIYVGDPSRVSKCYWQHMDISSGICRNGCPGKVDGDCCFTGRDGEETLHRHVDAFKLITDAQYENMVKE